MTFFVFFYFIHKKYLIIKFFFIKNVPINYPSLSKNRAKLSKSYPLFLNRYEKIWKKSEKNPKNPIFSLFCLWCHPHFYKKSCYHLPSETFKKTSQKKVEKKVVFIFANFFFKIHFGHFFMSNFKIKKKVLKNWILSTFWPFFNYWKLLFIPRKSIFHVFFAEFAFWEEHFIIHHFFDFF
jgi:hypothetical protein